MMKESEVFFKSLEHGVPDIIVHPAESGGHIPIRYFRPLVEDYLRGMAYLRVAVDADDSLSQNHRWRSVFDLLGTATDTTDVQILGAIEGDSLILENRRNDRNFPMLIPILNFVQEPERVIAQRLTGGVWGQRADVDLSGGGDATDTWMRDGRRFFHGKWKSRLTLIFGSHVGSVGFG